MMDLWNIINDDDDDYRRCPENEFYHLWKIVCMYVCICVYTSKNIQAQTLFCGNKCVSCVAAVKHVSVYL